MWIAAHPDDEAIAAPLLAKWCLDEGARCALLVVTRGEAGTCLLTGGCLPDVRSVRSAEAGSASELFRADSILLRFPDGGGINAPAWQPRPDEGPDIVSMVAAYIEAFRPDLILTFDPRHGSTCHPDHREIGSVVLHAAERLSFIPELYMLETIVRITNEPLRLHISAAIDVADRFVASQQLRVTGDQAWNATVADMLRHPSQFNAGWIAAVTAVADEERAVYVAPAKVALAHEVPTCK